MTEQATILLIDDEEPLLEVLGTALREGGYICLRSSSAAAALRLLDRTPEIDVIVSDIRMPGMDGIELLKTVRERYSDRSWLQVIFVTGHATLDNSIEALRLEAADFLYKPIRRQQLLDAVGKAVEKGATQRQTLTKLLDGHERLERLMLEARLLNDVLGAIKEAPVLKTERVSGSRDPAPASAEELPGKERLLQLLKTRDIKTRYFTDRLFVDPAWHMLLDLMENHLLERNVSVSSVYIASGVSSATASRRLDELEEAGLVQRWLDPNDKRRQFVQLTTHATELVTDYLVALGRTLAD